MADPSPTVEGADPSLSRCTARNGAGRPCRAHPVRGATVCVSHGGAAPQVRKAARKRVARAQAMAEWSNTYGELVPDADPSAVVLAEISHAAGHVRWLRARVRAFEPEALVWGVTSEVDRQAGEFPGTDTTRAAQANVWLELYNDERDRLIRMCAVAHKMGIEERRVALAEQLGDLVGAAIQGVLDDVGLTGDQWTRATAAVPARLREMALSIGGSG